MQKTRRDIIKTAGVLGVGSLMGLPLWAGPSDASLSDPAPQEFADAAAILLGLDNPKTIFDPNVNEDNYWVGNSIYAMLDEGAKNSLADFLKEYRSLAGERKTPYEIATALSKIADAPRRDGVGLVARLSLQMFLLGVWYGGTEIDHIPESANLIMPDYRKDIVVSARAYKNAWVWRFARTHPMGFSHYNFGSWAEEAPEVRDFLYFLPPGN